MSIARQRLVRRAGALVLLLAGVPAGAVVLASPASAAVLATACPNGALVGTTYTLTGNCAVTAPITVPDGITLDGGGFTISATDPPGAEWNGAIVTNAGTSMNIRNVTVTGPQGGFNASTNCGNLVYGIRFNDAGGTITNVTVDHIFQQQTGAFASCQTGRAIRADNATAPRTVDITNTTVRDYQKSGFEARGLVTMNLTGSTAGPPHPLEGLIAQNAVTFVNVTSGRVANNTIHGSSDQAPGPPQCNNCNPGNGTGVLLFGSSNVTVTSNTFTGLGTDIGVAVSAGSTGNTISFNTVARAASNNPANTDATGIGILVDSSPAAQPSPSSATLICNTFAGWKPDQNIVGAIQIDCTLLPAGTECAPYAAHTPDVQGGPELVVGTTSPRPAPRPTAPVVWTLIAGSLPPGVGLAPDGAITGSLPPNSAGTYAFTLRATEATGLTATHDTSIQVRPGCQAVLGLSTPQVRTEVSSARVTPGEPFRDRIHVSGLAAGHAATAVARFYGPFASRAEAACRTPHLVRTETLHVRNGSNRTSLVRINAPGVYTWQVTINADAVTASATHRCGQEAETILVAKPGYVAPAIKGGFSGTIGSSSDLERRVPMTVQMPGIGLNAAVRPEGVVDGRMTLPGDVGDVGWLQKSAGIGDKIGTAVLGGHVSDRHDNPGALFRLNRAHPGQRITVVKDGKRYQFKVVSKATFDRSHKLPHQYFATTGRHRLALISCTAKVVFPSGHFHYTRYIVVLAKQIRR
jgi:hypothetical protein